MKLKCLTQILKSLFGGLSLTGYIEIKGLRYVPIPFLAHTCSKLSFHHSSPPNVSDYIRQSYHGRPNKAGDLYERSLQLQGFPYFVPVPQSGLIFQGPQEVCDATSKRYQVSVRNVPDQFQINSKVLVDDHVSKVIHTTPRYFRVFAGEIFWYARRCFPSHLQSVKDCPLKHFVGLEFLVRHSFEVIRYEIDGVEDIPEPKPPYAIRHTPTRQEWRRAVPG